MKAAEFVLDRVLMLTKVEPRNSEVGVTLCERRPFENICPTLLHVPCAHM